VVDRRIVRAALVLAALVAVAVVVAGCGSSSSASPAAATTATGTTGTTTTPGGGGPNGAGFQAYRDCLTAHGVTLPARPGGAGGGPPGGGRPRTSTTAPPAGGGQGQGRGGFFGNLTPKQRQAMTACQSKRPAGGFGRGGGAGGGGNGPANGALAKYTACLKSHGVTFGSTSSSSPAFAKATAACKTLLPASTGGAVNGGTTTP
jgi:hypothetical protein